MDERDAVDDLPETLKSALVLVYHQGMKYREAADILGIPVGTVKSRIARARENLRALIVAACPEFDTEATDWFTPTACSA